MKRIREFLSRKGKRILLTTVVFTLLYAGFEYLKTVLPWTFGVQITKSIDCDVFLYRRWGVKPEEIERGDLVLFRIENYGVLSDAVGRFLLIKHYGGAPGDFLSCGERGCLLNGEPLGAPIPESLSPNFFPVTGIIPPGFFAPVGDDERSYDVRLAGLVPISAISGRVVLCLYPLDFFKEDFKRWMRVSFSRIMASLS